MHCDECGATRDVHLYPDEDEGDVELCVSCAVELGYAEDGYDRDHGEEIQEYDLGAVSARDLLDDEQYPYEEGGE